MIKLCTDYNDYGGQVERWKYDGDYLDCSCGCKHFKALDADWGVCQNIRSPRFQLLTFEHQAGYECFESE